MTNQSRGDLVPGGLAMIVGAHSCTENIGKIVTTERFVVSNDVAPDGSYYDGGEAWLCTGDGIYTAKVFGGPVLSGFSYTDPRHLLPINPEADPLDITEQMECKA